MKYLLVLFLTFAVASPVFAQVEKKARVSNHETDKQAEENRKIIKGRLAQIEDILELTNWVAPRRDSGGKRDEEIDTDEDDPYQMTKAQRQTEVKWSKWMLDVRKRLNAHATELRTLLKKKLTGEQMVEQMAQMNMQFLALQEAVQKESRKFQTLSNASKARHDIAMNAIRNIKA